MSALFLATAACSTSLQGGNYVLALQDGGLQADPCHLYDGGLWSGNLAISGSTLYMAYSLDNTELEGIYDAPDMGEPDEFEIDGTDYWPSSTPGGSAFVHDADGGVHLCQSLQLQVDMQATVTSSTSFAGTLSLSYELSPNVEGCVGGVGGLPPTCNLDASFVAVLSP